MTNDEFDQLATLIINGNTVTWKICDFPPHYVNLDRLEIKDGVTRIYGEGCGNPIIFIKQEGAVTTCFV